MEKKDHKRLFDIAKFYQHTAKTEASKRFQQSPKNKNENGPFWKAYMMSESIEVPEKQTGFPRSLWSGMATFSD